MTNPEIPTATAQVSEEDIAQIMATAKAQGAPVKIRPPESYPQTASVETKPRESAWYELDQLPSNGLSYKKPFSLRYRKYRFDEMEVINRSSLSEAEMVRMFLSGVELIQQGEPTPGKIASPDIDYITNLRKLRSLGVEADYTVQNIPCPICNAKLTHKFNIKQISYPELSDKGVATLPAILTLSDGTELSFSLMNADDLVRVLELNLPGDKEIVFGLARMAINGGTQMTEEQLIERIGAVLDAEDQEALYYLYDVLNPEVEPLKLVCKGSPASEGKDSTEHEPYTVLLPYEEVSSTLLKPFRTTEELVSAKIRFGS